MIRSIRRCVRASGLSRFRHDTRGVSFLEFALVLPVFVSFALFGVELANFVTTKMRVRQLALHMADNAARMGSGSSLAAKTISETQVNDLLIGGDVQAGKLKLYNNGRVYVSSLEPDAANTTSGNKRYKIAWQRCRGVKNRDSSYGVQGANNLTGMGPTGQQFTAPDSGQSIFVEVYYEYQPLIKSKYVPKSTLTEHAAMPVRDRRDTTSGSTALTNTEGASAHTCNLFTTT